MTRPKESPGSILARGARGAAADDPSKLLEAVDAALGDIEAILDLSSRRGADADARIAAEAGRDGIAPVLEPLLKKTRVYLARHPELDGDRAASILAGDTAAAAVKMRKHLAVLRDRLDDISPAPQPPGGGLHE